jgi:hypothetical protein
MLLETKKISQSSEIIYKNKVINKFSLIFSLILTPPETKITFQTLNLQQIEPEILNIMKPLLFEMHNFQLSLDHDEFVESGLTLFQSLTLDDKNKLLNY